MLKSVRGRRAAAVLVAVIATTASVIVSPPGAGAAGSGRYYKIVRTCAAAQPGHAHCFALRRVRVSSAKVPGARRLAETPAALPAGPAGGYTPADVAKAYGVNAAAATSQTVGIVDAYDDPKALADLNVFNDQYGLPHETSTSFRKVGQAGTATLPTADKTGWSGEISLDLDAVRGLCHKCKIILVEADSSSFDDLAAATNTAVRLGATEVSNSYGGSEIDPTDPPTAATKKAYNHPGVVITASTGDDGYYDWDNVNYNYAATPPPAGTQTSSSNAASLPAAYNTVVAVGGTTLQLNDDGTRSGEMVWNENGVADNTGFYAGSPQGASGGGCSTGQTAQKWQSSIAGYSRTACGTKRLVGDVAALADPYTGFDIYNSYQIPKVNTCTAPDCWATFGGTSLSSPLISAMWALAGGSGGVKYPSLSLYGHASSTKARYDVTVGGNGICGGTSPSGCASGFGGSPNLLGAGVLDCAWAGTTDTLAAGTRACNAATGYDGPTGVGTPRGLTLFKALTPAARISASRSITHGHAARFSGRSSTDPFPGGKIAKYSWNFGDHRTSSSSAPSHTYARKGSYTVSLTVTDSYARKDTVTKKVTVK